METFSPQAVAGFPTPHSSLAEQLSPFLLSPHAFSFPDGKYRRRVSQNGLHSQNGNSEQQGALRSNPFF